jgi:hypothetical protein
MQTKLELFYTKYPKKMVDSIFSKYSEINKEITTDYWDRLSLLFSLKEKNPYSSGKEYFSLLYGDKFSDFWKEKNKKILTPYQVEYWKNSGYTGEEAIEKIKEYKEKKATTLENFIDSYGEEEGRKKYFIFCEKSKHTKEKWMNKYGEKWGEEWEKYIRSKDSTSFKWALGKCNGDVDSAKKLFDERIESIKMDKEKKIKELGGVEEYKKYINRINTSKGRNFEDYLKKNGGDYKESMREYTEVLKKRRVKFGNASKVSLYYFMPIYNYLTKFPENRVFLEIEESSPFFLYDKQNSRSYCYDFCLMNKNTKLIIEFNGIKWHPKLDQYSMDDYKKISCFLKSDEKILEKYNYDRERERIALDNGFHYLEIWDIDSPKENIRKIESFFLKNKIKFNYEENDKNKINQKTKPRKINLGS